MTEEKQKLRTQKGKLRKQEKKYNNKQEKWNVQIAAKGHNEKSPNGILNNF